MKESSLTQYRHRSSIRIVLILQAMAYLASPLHAQAQAQTESKSEQTPPIQFSVSIPAAPEEMQIYKLEATKPPLEFLNEKLRGNKLPAMKMEQKFYVARGESGQEERDRVRAYVDPANGDLHFMPSFAELVRAQKIEKHEEPMLLKRAQSAGKNVRQHRDTRRSASGDDDRAGDPVRGRIPCLRARLARRGDFRQ